MKYLFGVPILLAALASVAFASTQDAAAPTVSFKINTATVAANKPLHGVITISFPEGLHGYQNPPTDPLLIPITVTSADKTFSMLKVDYPKGTATKMEGEPKPVNIYQGTIKIPVTLRAPAKLGKATLRLTIGYQECNEHACFPPGSLAAQAKVTVVKASASTKSTLKQKGNG